MTTRRAIRGVLYGLLGTFTSRNSDYEGYWLLGFLVADLDRRSIDLLDVSRSADSHSPWDFATALASAKFREQAAKLRVPLETVRHAELHVERLPVSATALINTERWQGSDVAFRAKATMVDGHSYECEVRVFVAPHNSLRESRSTRWDDLGLCPD